LYRLKDEEEAWDLGLTEYFDGDGLNFVEWPEQAPGVLPADAVLLEVRVNGLQHDGSREIFLSVPHQLGM
jgi:tRNA threonylcarbamoyladenosine biosynthesis protein TsaE